MDTENLKTYTDLVALAIEKLDLESLALYLEESPLDGIDRRLSDSFLKYFLELCEFVVSPDAANMIITHWENVNPTEDDMPTRTTIFTLPGIAVSTALFCARIDQRGCWIGHMMKLALYPSGPVISQACNLLSLIYGEQSAKVYKIMLHELDLIRDEAGETNDVMRDYVTDLYRLVSEYAERPKYLRQGPYEILPFHDELVAGLPKPVENQVVDIPPNDLAVQMLTDIQHGLKGVPLDDYDQSKEELADKFATLDPKIKVEMMKEFVKSRDEYNLFRDPDIFRVLGPAHPMTGTELDTDLDHPCAKFGGCRMITCIEFSNVDDDGEIYDELIEETKDYDSIDSFTGACEYYECNKRIRAKHEAVRIPQLDGGWSKEWYCSWKHARADVKRPNAVILTMIDNFESEFNTIGIQDRQWREKVVEPLPRLSYEEFITQAERYQGLPLRTSLPTDYNMAPFTLPDISSIEPDVVPVPIVIPGITLPPPVREYVPGEYASYSSPRFTEMSVIREAVETGGEII